MKTTQTGKDLTRLNITIPSDLWEWVKRQGDKANVSASLYLAKMIEKDKLFFDLTEKKPK